MKGGYSDGYIPVGISFGPLVIPLSIKNGYVWGWSTLNGNANSWQGATYLKFF